MAQQLFEFVTTDNMAISCFLLWSQQVSQRRFLDCVISWAPHVLPSLLSKSRAVKYGSRLSGPRCMDTSYQLEGL